MTSVKICGLRELEDLEFCLKSEVSWVGFNIWPGSKRFIEAGSAAAIWREGCARYPDATTKAALVCVDPSEAELAASLSEFPECSAVQLHGQESPEIVERLRKLVGSRQLWKAIRVSGPESFAEVAASEDLVDLLLFDGTDPGSGRGFDWSWLPDELGVPMGVAGGLSPDNVATLAQQRVDLIDVCSGVEVEPGKKDHTKIKAFLNSIGRS